MVLFFCRKIIKNYKKHVKFYIYCKSAEKRCMMQMSAGETNKSPEKIKNTYFNEQQAIRF